MIKRRIERTAYVAALVFLSSQGWTHGFAPSPLFIYRGNKWNRDAVRAAPKTVVYSSIGGDGDDRPPPNRGDENRKSWDDFLNREGEESANMRQAREYLSENSLPISYDVSDDAVDEISDTDDQELDTDDQEAQESDSSALVASTVLEESAMTQEDIMTRNPYVAVVSKLSPSDLISKFTATANPSVQNAVRSTILGLIGGLPKMAFETATITTGQKLASLMFQLQMTGYMFKNAEYRLSVQQSLQSSDSIFEEDKLLLVASSDGTESRIDPLAGKVKGKLRVKYEGLSSFASDDAEGEPVSSGLEMEVDAAAYMSELRTEVSKLRDELMVSRKEKDDALRKDLLLYIRTLPQQELQSLTNTMSQDVLVAMKGLVNAVMSGIGEGQIGPDTVTEQSGEAMAQLCMWQLVIGYNLRTLEVREEMRKSLTNGGSAPFGEAGVDSLQ